jgi:hypothetical protein
MEKEFTIGTKIDHEKYGEGIIIGVNVSTYDVLFERGGKIQFNKSRFDATVIGEINEDAQENPQNVTVRMLLEAVEAVLDRSGALQETIPLGERWLGGTMILQPFNKEQKAKEIPIEVFFHKIVMLRDRLRVLEQNINSNEKLTDEDKINLQQYITRIYGSLTTFNILFSEKDHYFTGTGGNS